MATLNTINCLQDVGNTGFGSCVLDFKNIVGAIRLPKGLEIDITALRTNLIAAAQNSNKALRALPFYNFLQTTDGTEDIVVQSFGTGAKKVVREGFNDWKFQYVDGGLTLHKQLRMLNNVDADFLFIDADNKIMCMAGSSATKIQGIPVTGGFFHAHPWKLNDGSKVAEYTLQFTMPVKYTNDLVNFVEADFDIPSTVLGLQDVNVTGAAGSTAGKYQMSLETASVGTNMGDLYPTELAAAGLWTAKNTATDAAITISAVSYNATTKKFVLTLTTTAPPYPASGTVTINLAAPSVLAAAGVDGFESTGAAVIAIS